MADITATIGVPNASDVDARRRTLVDIHDVPIAAWHDLFARAIEPNAFYHPAWACAASAHAREARAAKALVAYHPNERNRIIGLLPVVSGWRAYGLPLPFLVSWQPYTRLTTPLLDRDCAAEAAAGLIDAALASGARALVHADHSSNGAAAQAMREALARQNLVPRTLRQRERAILDATQDAETLLHDALGPKKLKELRRQRNRLEDGGAVTFEVARSSADVAAALEHFLRLEAGGWKGTRGTALAGDHGDTAFVRSATTALAADGCCEIITLSVAGSPVAAGIVLRHGSRAYFFKIAYDEELAKTSPGVQLTLELTRHLCADAGVTDVDSTANAYHPMIDKLWRNRLAVATALIPLRSGDQVAGIIEFLIQARERTRRDARRFYHRLLELREALR
jgi:CelD/BcsL family acetyltransferase involved in cellulose biosynthesis